MRAYKLAGLILACPVCALDTKPWLNDVYEFEFQSAFTYSHYRKVQGASVQLKHPSNDKDILLDLGFVPSQSVDMQAEMEFAQTPRENWGTRSGALQVRYQWLDDIAGDPVSFVTGLTIRGVTGRSLRDVSTPYASNANFELTFSMGKEWSDGEFWTMRTYGMAAIGMANRSYPWTRELFVWQRNWANRHRLTLFAEGDFGFGGKQHVDVRHFHGWGKVQHQSIDLGVGYGYHTQLWGTFTASYAYRVFAHNFPERVSFLMMAYTIPFSFF
jgi:hypothetical protein